MKTKEWLTGILLLICGMVLMPDAGLAQDSTMYRVTTNDGNHFIGSIVKENAHEIILDTQEFGEVTIQRLNISKMEEYEPDRLKADGYWFENPHSTRYLIGTNAIALKKGQGYYQNAWIFFNNINAGITDNISMGVGFVPTFLFGTSAVPIWLMPKVSIPLANDNLHFAAGGLFGGVIGEVSAGLGIAYGAMTIGNTDRNISLGLGYGYADGEWSDSPFVNVGGSLRMSKKMYLVSENYFFSVGDDGFGLLSAAIRWSPENFAVDFGLMRTTESWDIIGIPWLGVALPFGK